MPNNPKPTLRVNAGEEFYFFYPSNTNIVHRESTLLGAFKYAFDWQRKNPKGEIIVEEE